MIQSFRDRATERLWAGARVKRFMDVVEKIKRGDRSNNGTVTNPDKIISAKIGYK